MKGSLDIHRNATGYKAWPPVLMGSKSALGRTSLLIAKRLPAREKKGEEMVYDSGSPLSTRTREEGGEITASVTTEIKTQIMETSPKGGRNFQVKGRPPQRGQVTGTGVKIPTGVGFDVEFQT